MSGTGAPEPADRPEATPEALEDHLQACVEEYVADASGYGEWALHGDTFEVQYDDTGSVTFPIVMRRASDGREMCVDVHVSVWEEQRSWTTP